MGRTQVAAATTMTNEEKIYQYLKNDLGLNCAATAAVMGNILRESTYRPEAHNVAENAWGICQWRGSRLENLQKLYPLTWKTLESQLNFLKDELEGADYAGPRTYSYLKQLPDTSAGAQDGAHYFAKTFERCAPFEIGIRETYAVTLHNARHAIVGEKTKPVISGAKIIGSNADGYTVTFRVTDNQALSYVQVATWTKNGYGSGRDDQTWETIDISGKTAQEM